MLSGLSGFIALDRSFRDTLAVYGLFMGAIDRRWSG